MSRFAAFAIHLGISLVVFFLLAALVVYVWYPDFFFYSDGGWEGIRIIILVDLVLGPLLTLIVFDRRKPELKRDLAIIGMIQVSCLAAGTYVVWDERPLALVYVDGRFYSMTADDYRQAGVDLPDLSRIPGPSPKRVAVALPEDYAEQSEVRSRHYRSGVPLRAVVDRYQPLRYDMLNVPREAVDPETLLVRDQQAGMMGPWLERHGGSLDDYAFFPFATRYRFVHLAVSRTSGEIAGLLATPFG